MPITESDVMFVAGLLGIIAFFWYGTLGIVLKGFVREK